MFRLNLSTILHTAIFHIFTNTFTMKTFKITYFEGRYYVFAHIAFFGNKFKIHSHPEHKWP
jgi:hypothetical protein